MTGLEVSPLSLIEHEPTRHEDAKRKDKTYFHKPHIPCGLTEYVYVTQIIRVCQIPQPHLIILFIETSVLC